jgi:transcription-repair coupling factor (superfamily II helicase)
MNASPRIRRKRRPAVPAGREHRASVALRPRRGLLDRLGGGRWQAKKAKLKERIREMADKLIRIAAERALRKAPVLEPPSPARGTSSPPASPIRRPTTSCAPSRTCSGSGRGPPMDRLICGDVGFGKTEVAMRAAFVAAMSGRAGGGDRADHAAGPPAPTSFAERFRGFPLKVASSRASSAKEAAETREGWPRATVDIVIGTHALLAKGIKFKNLGLLIIDEEQHFGVQHKERLKAAALRRPCADADRHADPAHAATVAVGRARSVDHRHAARRPPVDPHLCQRVRHR